jgi:hypothetical protein
MGKGGKRDQVRNRGIMQEGRSRWEAVDGRWGREKQTGHRRQEVE